MDASVRSPVTFCRLMTGRARANRASEKWSKPKARPVNTPLSNRSSALTGPVLLWGSIKLSGR